MFRGVSSHGAPTRRLPEQPTGRNQFGHPLAHDADTGALEGSAHHVVVGSGLAAIAKPQPLLEVLLLEQQVRNGLIVAACVLLSLGTPDRVISQTDETGALDGTVNASRDEYEAFWSYHPTLACD